MHNTSSGGYISIHALRVEGDLLIHTPAFLSCSISIHALRVEGDLPIAHSLQQNTHFYPRPPGGGRHTAERCRRDKAIFLSTPSGWRATTLITLYSMSSNLFLSTPSGWRATWKRRGKNDNRTDFYPRPPGGGRRTLHVRSTCPKLFLSTPSGWRATGQWYTMTVKTHNFYPRPPGGGRPSLKIAFILFCQKFLSTPSGWRATHLSRRSVRGQVISIHALRVEGDRRRGG